MVDHNDGAHAPLIGPDPAQDVVFRESGTPSPTPFIWALTFAAGISGLLFGYDVSYLSAFSLLVRIFFQNREHVPGAHCPLYHVFDFLDDWILQDMADSQIC